MPWTGLRGEAGARPPAARGPRGKQTLQPQAGPVGDAASSGGFFTSGEKPRQDRRPSRSQRNGEMMCSWYCFEPRGFYVIFSAAVGDRCGSYKLSWVVAVGTIAGSLAPWGLDQTEGTNNFV